MRAVIVNPASASGRTARRWRRIVASLEDGVGGGPRVEVELTRRAGDGIAIARRLVDEGVRELVVLGGDGTIGEVVAGCVRPDGSGMARDDIELAIVHQGTGGDLARGLGLPRDEAGAVAVARSGARRRIDVGVATYVDGSGAPTVRGFVSTANVGMAAEVVELVGGRLKRLGNNGSFAAATVRCLARNDARTVRVVTQEGIDATLDVVDVSVCNNGWMGGGMHVAPRARLDDGRFDVVIIAAAGRIRLIRTFPRIYSGAHVRDPLVRVERTVGLAVEVPDGRPAQGVVLDGELVGATPASFRVLPGALTVRVPTAAK